MNNTNNTGNNNSDITTIKFLLQGILACLIIIGLVFVPVFSIAFWGLIVLSIAVVIRALRDDSSPPPVENIEEPSIPPELLPKPLTPEERKRQDRISFIGLSVFLGLILLTVIIALFFAN